MESHDPLNYATQDFDDELYLLTRNLIITEDLPRSSGGEPFLPREELLAPRDVANISQVEAHYLRQMLMVYERRIGRTPALLRRVLAVFQQRHSELTDHLVTLDPANEELYSDLRERAQHPSNTMTHGNTAQFDEAWSRVLTVDLLFYRHKLNSVAWDTIDEGCVVATDLAQSIDWLYAAIGYLSDSYHRIRKARAVLTPALRLDPDTLFLIFELSAELDAPSETNLGWMKLAHVCSAWRDVLLSMSSLWARDAGVFGAAILSQTLVARAAGLPVSISPARMHVELPGTLGPLQYNKHVYFMLHDISFLRGLLVDQGTTIRVLNVMCFDTDMSVSIPDQSSFYTLHRILGDKLQPHLRSVNIAMHWTDREPRTLVAPPRMAHHPNLRHITFLDSFLPFSLPDLESLHVLGSNKKIMPQAWFDALLGALESSQALKDFRIFWHRLPAPNPNARQITLPQLNSFCTSNLSIFKLLDIPALQRATIIVNCRSSHWPNLSEALRLVFQRYGPAIRTMSLSQRVLHTPATATADTDLLIVHLGWSPSSFPTSPTIPVAASDALHKYTDAPPGSGISLIFYVDLARARKPLSVLFSQVMAVLTPTALAGVEALGFDNETREHTLGRTSERGPWRPMIISLSPSATRLVIPLRDYDTAYHIVWSLQADVNMAALPLLNRLEFVDIPLSKVRDNTPFLSSALQDLLRLRALNGATTEITSMHYKIYTDSDLSSTRLDAAGLLHYIRRDIVGITYALVTDNIRAIPSFEVHVTRPAVNERPSVYDLSVTIVYELMPTTST